MNVNRKDFASGAIYCVIGALYMVYALQTLPIGEALNMGPGYFPVVLSGIVMALGLIVIVRSFILLESTPFGRIPWRAAIMITLALLFFALLIRPLGIGLTTLGTVMLACAASSQITLRAAVLTGLAVSIFCWLVFTAGVGLPLPLFGRWFEGTPIAQVEEPLRALVLLVVSLPRAAIQFLAGLVGR